MQKCQLVVRLDSVSKAFRDGSSIVRAVDRVSLNVQPGEFVCLYGASGSGKSTLLNLVSGLDVPDEGIVEVLGSNIATWDGDQRADMRLAHIGVIFQDDNLIDEFTAAENVTLPLLARGDDRDEAHASAEKALARVGIGHLADRLPSALSGGERQRVGVARGLVGQRQLLIADEPTGALDSDNSRALFALIRDLCATGELNALVATHDPLAEKYASRVLRIRDGSVVDDR